MVNIGRILDNLKKNTNNQVGITNNNIEVIQLTQPEISREHCYVKGTVEMKTIQN